MSNLVDRDKISSLVRAERDYWLHIGRHDFEEEGVYIMHSHLCLSLFPDLRECPYSKALDKGISVEHWFSWEDDPVYLRNHETYGLIPIGFVEDAND